LIDRRYYDHRCVDGALVVELDWRRNFRQFRQHSINAAIIIIVVVDIIIIDIGT
jgi:hypothetical protein